MDFAKDANVRPPRDRINPWRLSRPDSATQNHVGKKTRYEMEDTMRKKRTLAVSVLIVIALFFLVLPPQGGSQPVIVDCSTESLQRAIDLASFGATISVSGTCNENITIPSKALILNGGGTATIHGPNASQPSVAINTGNSIRGFKITGGMWGVLVARNSFVRIDSNTIEFTGGDGIFLVEDTSARITNNTIQSNPGDGILVNVNSTARIGFDSILDTVASPNRIEHNGGNGITLLRSSSAIIVGNTICDNGDNGVKVAGVSQADISANIINGNQQNGILVTQNSGVNLGNDTEDTIFDLPNTTTVGNGLFGLKGTIGGYADGRLGTLNGLMGRVWFDFRSINSTKPWVW